MSTATTLSNLMGLGMPWPLARYWVNGPNDFGGIQTIAGYSGVTLTLNGSTATSATSSGGSVAIAGAAGGSTSGDGGSIYLTPGSVTSGNVGSIVNRGRVITQQAAPTALTTTATLTPAQILGGLLTANQGAGATATYTLPTGATLEAAIGHTMAVNDAFDFTLINISTAAAEDVTIATAAGWTLVGNMTVASNAATTDQSSGMFRLRRTAANTYTLYRIA